MTTPQPYPDPPRNWKRAAKLIGSWVGILALAQGCLMITPEPTTTPLRDEPPPVPTIAVSRYIEDSFRDRENAAESQCSNFTGLEPSDLRAMQDQWRDRSGRGGSASYLRSETHGLSVTAEVEHTYPVESSGLIGTSTTAVNIHEFEAEVEEYGDGVYCVASLEYIDPTHESPISHISHYLMYVEHGDTDDANAAECPEADTTTERNEIEDLYAEVEQIDDDRAWNESGDTQHIENGLLIPWSITSEQTDNPFMELKFYLQEIDPGYCIERIEIMDLLHD